ncbi:recombinase family protein, partial [bacterium]|nr:recombinase family protein [bacterium]
STLKQVKEGDTIEEQIRHCTEYVAQQDYTLLKVFPIVETGTNKPRDEFDDLITYCKNPENDVEVLVFRNIDRLTRGGSYVYKYLKTELAKYGVTFEDVYKLIQPSLNTLDHTGFEYDWSKYSPSEKVETYEADRAQDEVRTILTRMIGAEINYARQGYWSRGAILGFTSNKVEGESGKKRSVLVAHSQESAWVRRIFKLKSENILNDNQIVEHINDLGFRTKQFTKRDKLGHKIGYGGGELLTIKKMNLIIQSTVYAGFICEKWTNYQPIKAKFKGLVDIKTFNLANRGKVAIIEDKYGYKLEKNLNKMVGVNRNSNNPLFPYKNYIVCKTCGKILKGSRSRGKSGKRYPSYFCDRDHKRESYSKSELESVVGNFVKEVKFSSKFIEAFKEIVSEKWEEEKKEVQKEVIEVGKSVTELRVEAKNIYENIKTTTSQFVKRDLEREYDEIQRKIAKLTEKRDTVEDEELDIQEMLNWVTHFMEHPYKIIEDSKDAKEKGILFNMFFESKPTVTQLKNGTPNLSPLFKLSRYQKLPKEQLVTLRRVELRFPG